jgi:hypothetical protein
MILRTLSLSYISLILAYAAVIYYKVGIKLIPSYLSPIIMPILSLKSRLYCSLTLTRIFL